VVATGDFGDFLEQEGEVGGERGPSIWREAHGAVLTADVGSDGVRWTSGDRGSRGRAQGPCSVGFHTERRVAECGARATRCRSKEEKGRRWGPGSTHIQVEEEKGGAASGVAE
jgi:hypothetical protein